MGLIYINTYCKECDSDNVISNYNEEENDIICICLNCSNKGTLRDFDYLMDGDTEI